MVRSKGADDTPAELVAVMVKVVVGRLTVGIPLMMQVELLIERPDGRPGRTVHEVIAPPVSAMGAMESAAPAVAELVLGMSNSGGKTTGSLLNEKPENMALSLALQPASKTAINPILKAC
jgi:hypothetical protein